MTSHTSLLASSIDFTAQGRQIGDIRLPWSSNERPAGYYAIPVAVLNRGSGPTLLLLGGVHGDEYIGPSALFQFIHSFDINTLSGRLIVLPALNTPAVLSMTRCSPLDQGNLNRAFGPFADRASGQTPTRLIADYLENQLMPSCDAVVDIHSGGLAHLYAPLAMVYLGAEKADAQSLALARAFGAPRLWAAHFSEQRSVNAAAVRNDLPMIALELGGGVGAAPDRLEQAQIGIRGVLAHLGMAPTAGAETTNPRRVAVSDPGLSHSPREGLFVRSVNPGQAVASGDPLGALYSFAEPERDPLVVRSAIDGVVLAVFNRGKACRGDMLAIIARLD